MPRSVKLLVVGFWLLGVLPRGNARFAATGPQCLAVFFAVESLVTDNGAVAEVFNEGRRGRMIARLATGQNKFRCQAQQSVTDGVNFGIEAASGSSDGLILPALRAV